MFISLGEFTSLGGEKVISVSLQKYKSVLEFQRTGLFLSTHVQVAVNSSFKMDWVIALADLYSNVNEVVTYVLLTCILFHIKFMTSFRGHFNECFQNKYV